MKSKEKSKKRILVDSTGRTLKEIEITPPKKPFSEAKIKCVLGLATEISFLQFWLSLLNLSQPKKMEFEASIGATDQNMEKLTNDYDDWDAILLLEWDHIFEQDSLKTLWNDNLPVVAGIYKSRKHDSFPYLVANEFPHYEYIKPPSMEKVFNVQSTGLGFMLVRKSVFRELQKPRFGILEGGIDRYFCRKLSMTGFKIWVDPTVRVGHLTMRYV